MIGASIPHAASTVYKHPANWRNVTRHWRCSGQPPPRQLGRSSEVARS